MNKTIKQMLSLIVVLLSLSTVSIAQDCSIVSEGGTFTYGNNNEITIIINGTSHTETYDNGYISSTLSWTSDCEYTMSVDEVTISDYIFSTGATVSVVINSIVGKEITYTSTVGELTWESEMTKE